MLLLEPLEKMKEPRLSMNQFNEKEEDLLGKQKMKELNTSRNLLRVTNYDSACEDHNKIECIIPVTPSVCKQ